MTLEELAAKRLGVEMWELSDLRFKRDRGWYWSDDSYRAGAGPFKSKKAALNSWANDRFGTKFGAILIKELLDE